MQKCFVCRNVFVGVSALIFMTSHRYQHNFAFSTIENSAKRSYSPLLFVLFSPKEKCWCTQNLWDVWWKCYSH